MTQARALIVDTLTELLPDHKIVRVQRDPGVIERPTIVIKQSSIIPEPSAPLAWLRVSFVITIVTELTDPERAEDALDALVPDLIRRLETVPALEFESAVKVSYGPDENFAYDLTVQTITPKE
ncbi:hypothetical protein [Herbiconiux flava]|uniref:DUF3168 domain-containing protein n=1 Tax=Herbiconiux flava TaxID=881268 RepID=A0A852STI0_9MICO|nr:hypothetical protein [Herbiconiux flava]NYD72296.1 hypothetical protein [Herbiconiux flava]GLK17741.1 hypothetical protein GCM10017602_22230 [Herbiconiux flava]